MNPQTIAAIKDALRKEKQSLVASAEALRQQLEATESDLCRIEAAIAALDGTDAKAMARRKLPKDKTKPATPAAGKEEVIRYMQAALEEESVLPEKELKERVEKLAQQNGFTRLGIGLRISDAMKDPRFVVTPAGVRLSLLGSATKVGA
jgi:hypothetical protein